MRELAPPGRGRALGVRDLWFEERCLVHTPAFAEAGIEVGRPRSRELLRVTSGRVLWIAMAAIIVSGPPMSLPARCRMSVSRRALRIGVLALQGGFAAHARALRQLGAEVTEVRTPDQLEGLDGAEAGSLMAMMQRATTAVAWRSRPRLSWNRARADTFPLQPCASC